MKRRSLLKTLAAAPAVPVLITETARAQEAPQAQPLTFSPVDAVADRVPQFFNARQFATLRRLCDALEPASNNLPSANDARVPEFLDFWTQQSPREKQQLYLSGLDALEREARDRFNRAFAQADDAHVRQLLSPLQQPWTHTPPSRMAEFLRDARSIVRSATRNSYEWDSAGRGAAGNYWKVVD